MITVLRIPEFSFPVKSKKAIKLFLKELAEIMYKYQASDHVYVFETPKLKKEETHVKR